MSESSVTGAVHDRLEPQTDERRNAPEISVIIPVLNGAATIGEQLTSLSRQDFEGSWEVVIADNGSTDDTAAVVESFADAVPGLRMVDARGRTGAGGARNVGAESARGSLLVFCDADDVVQPGWLRTMVGTMQEHAFVAGAIDHDRLNGDVPANWHFRSHVDGAPLALRFLPYALTANVGVTRAALDEVGGFTENLRSSAAGEDVELSWRLQLAGYQLHFEPGAVVAYRHRSDLGSLWRQHYHYGEIDPVLYRRFRGEGVPPLGVRSMLGAYIRLSLRFRWLFSPTRRGLWLRELAKHLGRIRGSIRERVMYL